jgi:hypothetical protein
VKLVTRKLVRALHNPTLEENTYAQDLSAVRYAATISFVRVAVDPFNLTINAYRLPTHLI